MLVVSTTMTLLTPNRSFGFHTSTSFQQGPHRMWYSHDQLDNGMNESDVQLTLGHGSYLIGDAPFGTLLTMMIKLPDPTNQVAIVGKP